MYYLDRRQMDVRLDFLPGLSDVCRQLTAGSDWPEGRVRDLALERVVHLALETVTDIGSLMIDAFIMRDAASYEDIIAILHDEKVVGDDLVEGLTRLVRLRKPLVQQYYDLDRQELQMVAGMLPGLLDRFAEAVRAYLARELLD